MIKNHENACCNKKKQYLCTRKRLGYGVMVTLQILVLPFLVRVRVAQRKKPKHLLWLFFLVTTYNFLHATPRASRY